MAHDFRFSGSLIQNILKSTHVCQYEMKLNRVHLVFFIKGLVCEQDPGPLGLLGNPCRVAL